MSDDPFAHLIPPLRKLMDLRTKRDTAKQAAVDAEKAYKAQETVVHDAMATAGKQPVITLDLGEPWGTVKFQRRETVYGKVYDHEEAVKQARELGLDEELLMPATSVKFREAALNQHVREAMEHGQDLPPGIEPNIRKFVSISRKRKR